MAFQDNGCTQEALKLQSNVDELNLQAETLLEKWFAPNFIYRWSKSGYSFKYE